MQTYAGSCQCGALRFEADTPGMEGAMRCNCSRCRRTGAVFIFTDRENFRWLSGVGRSTVYRFNKKEIEHHFCPVCGVQPFGFGAGPDGSEMAAVNLRCVEGVDPEQVEAAVFDGAEA